MKEEHEHIWRPVVSEELLRTAGSEAARIGSFCTKCDAHDSDAFLMEKQLTPLK